MKRFVSICLILTVFLIPMTGMVSVGYAGNEAEHEKMMKKILLKDEAYFLKEKPQQQAFMALLYASQLAIDEANRSKNLTDSDGKWDKHLTMLEQYGVGGLPAITAIDFGCSQHRDHTHHGWDYVYPVETGSDSDKAHWSIRKDILLKTTAKVFDFPTGGHFLWIEWDYDKKCNSMAAFIYYIHLLEDHQDYFEKHKDKQNECPEIMPFVSENKKEPDVISEIIKHLKILFKDQKGGKQYEALFFNLKEIREEAIRIKGKGTGVIDTAEKRDLYSEQVDECVKTLSFFVHKLLKNEDFWTKVFP